MQRLETRPIRGHLTRRPPSPSPDPDATSSCITHRHSSAAAVLPRHPVLLSLSRWVLKIQRQRGRRMRIALPPSSLSRLLVVATSSSAPPSRGRSWSPSSSSCVRRWSRRWRMPAMGRSSRACSLLGSTHLLLLLLLSVGSAVAQNGSTWKTLSGKLWIRCLLTSFLPRFPH